jgi:hypothetical protein
MNHWAMLAASGWMIGGIAWVYEPAVFPSLKGARRWIGGLLLVAAGWELVSNFGGLLGAWVGCGLLMLYGGTTAMLGGYSVRAIYWSGRLGPLVGLMAALFATIGRP